MKNLKKVTRQEYARRMFTVLNYIQSHLDDDIVLDDLARLACFSKYHFHRIFHGMVGETLKRYVRRLRLERAATRLIRTRQSVTSIAFEAGYESHEAFTRAFNTMFKMSPTQFRSSKSFIDKSENHNLKIEAGNMKVEIIEFEPLKVLCVRHVGPYDQCGIAWNKLCTWAAPKGLLRPGCTFLGLSYDDPAITPPDKIRYEACLSLDADCPVEGDIHIKQIGGGHYAKTTHFGPYEKLSDTYNQLCGQWIPANEYKIASKPSIEIYLNSPEDTEPEDLITDIHVPLD